MSKSNLSDISLMIKTFERAYCVNRLVKSIRHFYPAMKIYIADDGKQALDVTGTNIHYFHLPFNTGLSYGRNFILKKIDTPYFVLLDDDYEFNSQTDLIKMLKLLKQFELDILGGKWIQHGIARHYEYQLAIEKRVLKYINQPLAQPASNLFLYDLVLNFFIARTDAVRAINGWDEKLKLLEHTDFFLRAKQAGLKTGYCPDIHVYHKPLRNKHYNKFRFGQETQHYRQLLKNKWNYDRIEKIGDPPPWSLPILSAKFMDFLHKRIPALQ